MMTLNKTHNQKIHMNKNKPKPILQTIVTAQMSGNVKLRIFTEYIDSLHVPSFFSFTCNVIIHIDHS